MRFWKVVLPLVVGGILLVGLVLVFRPVARTGAVAYAQANLERAAEAAEDLASAGSLADADRETLAAQGGIDDLLLIDPDQSSAIPGGQRARDPGGLDGFGPRPGSASGSASPQVPVARSGPCTAPGPTARRTRRAKPSGGWPQP